MVVNCHDEIGLDQMDTFCSEGPGSQSDGNESGSGFWGKINGFEVIVSSGSSIFGNKDKLARG